MPSQPWLNLWCPYSKCVTVKGNLFRKYTSISSTVSKQIPARSWHCHKEEAGSNYSCNTRKAAWLVSRTNMPYTKIQDRKTNKWNYGFEEAREVSARSFLSVSSYCQPTPFSTIISMLPVVSSLKPISKSTKNTFPITVPELKGKLV